MIETIKKLKVTCKCNTCVHERDVTYKELVQVDGIPYYIVKCIECEEYGTIELLEGKNTFEMTLEQINIFKEHGIHNQTLL
jgi:hypothetical protein